MGWRYRKAFKLAPWLRINVGKTGITSATIGKRGASLNIGRKGVYTNLGIPGTGLSYRNKIKLKETGNMKASKINQLEKLEKLYINGNLSDSEYQRLRADILGYAYPSEEIQKKGCLSSLWTLIKWIFFICFLLIGYSIYHDSKSSKKETSEAPINLPPPNTIQEEVIERHPRKDSDLKKLDEDKGKSEAKSLDNLF
ncbi:hypothetical protein BHC46_02630 [Snodgrassella alvi]|uniref:DUF4236 domain-containing protein n=1 Tax=Snodgrassella alvi TaxID=1196083 RepID=A0A2N9XLE7_9NEIS|nr:MULTISPECIES: DUF4236 domain-containing protein [Snodgrassella]PIT21421.1 hypothetical protein BGI34_01025 [Snodgrassella alvi]PIT49152.1 hypothetical protein BHC46_02630 [Snodgrassella alvi]SCC09532.1 Protein of unknown function [Snodgrassella sp. R-53583]